MKDSGPVCPTTAFSLAPVSRQLYSAHYYKSGIGGRDWTAVQAIMHIITYLVTSHSTKKLAGFDWWIIPLLNPDGYINSMDNKVRRFSPLLLLHSDLILNESFIDSLLFYRCRGITSRT